MENQVKTWESHYESIDYNDGMKKAISDRYDNRLEQLEKKFEREKEAIEDSDSPKDVKKEKIKEKAKAGIAQMEDFSRVGSVVIKDKQQWIGLIFRNAVKMTCLYALPAVAIFAVTGERLPLSVLECLAFSSVMQLLIGVIPSSGGTGSTELVFLMLFGSMTEKSVCGAAMILYRMATYYLPFLISIPLLFFGKRSTEA